MNRGSGVLRVKMSKTFFYPFGLMFCKICWGGVGGEWERHFPRSAITSHLDVKPHLKALNDF